MTLRLRVNVLLHVWSYDFYDMTLSTTTSYDKFGYVLILTVVRTVDRLNDVTYLRHNVFATSPV